MSDVKNGKHRLSKPEGRRPQFRIRIPADLVGVYGKKEIRFSLKTADPAQASLLCSIHSAKYEAEFAQHRRERAARELALASPETYRNALRELQAALVGASSDGEAEQLEANAEAVEDSARAQAERVEATKGLGAARRFYQSATATGLSLPELVEKYAKHSGMRLSSRSELDLAVRELGWSGPVAELRKKDIADFRDRLTAQGRKPASVKKKLGLLRAALRFAVDEELIPSNPCDGVRPPRIDPTEEGRVPFTVAQLKTLYAAPRMTDPTVKSRSRVKGDSLYWLSTLALYSGARLGELAQLRVEDVAEVEGVPVLRIGAEGTKVKTAGSRRAVPLHPKLLELGFKDFVESRRKEGNRLFPELAVTKLGKVGQEASKEFARMLDSVGLSDGGLTFHSFRHTFKDACREAGISEEVHDALTGHSGGRSVGRAYGLGVPVRRLAEDLRKVRFGDFDPPSVYAV
jgi:integrase